MDYLQYVKDLAKKLSENIVFVFIYKDDLEDREIYNDYDIASILQEHQTSNLYDAIYRTTGVSDVLVYGMKFVRNKEGYPKMVALGVLNVTGDSWRPLKEEE